MTRFSHSFNLPCWAGRRNFVSFSPEADWREVDGAGLRLAHSSATSAGYVSLGCSFSPSPVREEAAVLGGMLEPSGGVPSGPGVGAGWMETRSEVGRLPVPSGSVGRGMAATLCLNSRVSSFCLSNPPRLLHLVPLDLTRACYMREVPGCDLRCT